MGGDQKWAELIARARVDEKWGFDMGLKLTGGEEWWKEEPFMNFYYSLLKMFRTIVDMGMVKMCQVVP